MVFVSLTSEEAKVKLVLLALLAATCVPASGTISSLRTMSGRVWCNEELVLEKPWGLEARKTLQLRGGAEWGGQSCDDATPCIGTLQNFSALEDFYAAGDSNAAPSGKMRQVSYGLVAGEAGWLLRMRDVTEF